MQNSRFRGTEGRVEEGRDLPDDHEYDNKKTPRASMRKYAASCIVIGFIAVGVVAFTLFAGAGGASLQRGDGLATLRGSKNWPLAAPPPRALLPSPQALFDALKDDEDYDSSDDSDDRNDVQQRKPSIWDKQAVRKDPRGLNDDPANGGEADSDRAPHRAHPERVVRPGGAKWKDLKSLLLPKATTPVAQTSTGYRHPHLNDFGTDAFHLPLPATWALRCTKETGGDCRDPEPPTGEADGDDRKVRKAYYEMEQPSIAKVSAATLPPVTADTEKQEAVKEAFLWSWNAYKEHAWGSDTLKPVSQRPDNGFLHMGITITDSLSTMAIMGLEEEFQLGAKWVSEHLAFDSQEDINVFESTIRVVGGLTSAWFLTDKKYPDLLQKAVDLADAYHVAFTTPTGLPFGTVGLKSKRAYNPAWLNGGSTISEVASLQLELEALSYATGDAKYACMGRKIMSHLMVAEVPADSLYPMYISPAEGTFASTTITFGARGDSLYEYLVKQYVLAGGLQSPLNVGNPALLSSHTPVHLYGVPPTSPARGKWDDARRTASAEYAAVKSNADLPSRLYVCNDATLSVCPSGGADDAGSVAFPWFLGIDPGLATKEAAAAAAAEGAGGDGGAVEAAVDSEGIPSSALTEASWFTQLYGMYLRSMAGMEEELVRTSNPSSFTYIAERQGRVVSPKMDHLVCFVPGMLALGSLAAPTQKLREHHVQLARDIMATCIHMYDQTATGIAAEITRFPNGGDPEVDGGAKHNLLRPETMESLHVLYRITGDESYREAGWRMFNAWQKHSRVPTGGYSTLRDVTQDPPVKADVQESFWLAETLKYAYLLFSDSETIPITEYVFNTEAHPLPIFKPST